MPPSKFETNLTLRLGVRHPSFSLFPLASWYSNDYYRTYAIIDFLTCQLSCIGNHMGCKLEKKFHGVLYCIRNSHMIIVNSVTYIHV